MNKQSAINALENQKEKIKGDMKPEIWMHTTSELLKKIFPISGVSKSKQISDICFYPWMERKQYLIDQQVQKGRIEAERYMQEFIEEINIAGIEKLNSDSQIIQLIKNIYFWIVLACLISGSFAFGNYFGSSKFDNEKVQLYEAKKILENELVKKDALIEIKEKLVLENKNIIDSLNKIKTN